MRSTVRNTRKPFKVRGSFMPRLLWLLNNPDIPEIFWSNDGESVIVDVCETLQDNIIWPVFGLANFDSFRRYLYYSGFVGIEKRTQEREALYREVEHRTKGVVRIYRKKGFDSSVALQETQNCGQFERLFVEPSGKVGVVKVTLPQRPDGVPDLPTDENLAKHDRKREIMESPKATETAVERCEMWLLSI